MISDQASQSTSDLDSRAVPDAELYVVLSKAYAEGKIILQGNQQNKALTRICHKSDESIMCIDLEGYNRVIEYEHLDQVISVETGIKINHLNSILEGNNQYFPCAGHSDSSLLDVINSGDCGSFEHSCSGMRSLILGLTIALPCGEVIKTGGKVVKNVSGYDLTKLFVGSRGTLGLPLQAHLRLFAKPQQNVTMAFKHDDYLTMQKALNKLLRTGLPLSACEFFIDNASLKWQKQVVLLLNIAEHRSVISELIPQIESFLLVDGIEKISCEPGVFSEVDDLMKTFEWSIETSLSQDRMLKLQTNLRTCDIAAHYRPAIGRTRLLASNEDQARQVSAWLKDLSTDEEPLMVASANENFEYYVEQFPVDDKNLNGIKSKIKSKFDPHNRMNPFARL